MLVNYKYYLTLTYNGLRVKTGDCVYIFRSKDNEKHSSRKTPTKERPKSETSVRDYKTDYIIFRVQNLAVNESGQKLLFGHHFLRPSETYHEPSRKFFDNEVLRSPLTEWVPIDEVKGICCVLDYNTFCKGRPKGFREEDVFVCEFRVDRHAKQFNRISSKSTQFAVNTKSYAFDMFETKLNVKRTYSPHRVPESYFKTKCNKTLKTTFESNSKKEIQNKKRRMENVLKLSDRLLERAVKLLQKSTENQLNCYNCDETDKQVVTVR